MSFKFSLIQRFYFNPVKIKSIVGSVVKFLQATWTTRFPDNFWWSEKAINWFKFLYRYSRITCSSESTFDSMHFQKNVYSSTSPALIITWVEYFCYESESRKTWRKKKWANQKKFIAESSQWWMGTFPSISHNILHERTNA